MRNISLLDVKLLVVFDALMSERSVTRAARRLNLSQPAVSNALHRLREILGDELFHRSADGMRPTPRAMEIFVPVSHVLHQIEGVMQPAKFRPEESVLSFRLAISPPVSLILLPVLVPRLRERAPGVQLRVQSAPVQQASALLDSQVVDIVISVVAAAPKRYHCQVLYRDTYVALMRARHPLARGPMQLKRLVTADHLLVSQTMQSYNLFDDAIARHGLKRNIRMTLTDWMTAVEVIARTDLVTAIFKRTAQAILRTSRERLVMRPTPLPAFDVVMLSHHSFSKHPAYEWLREQIMECCSTGPR